MLHKRPFKNASLASSPSHLSALHTEPDRGNTGLASEKVLLLDIMVRARVSVLEAGKHSHCHITVSFTLVPPIMVAQAEFGPHDVISGSCWNALRTPLFGTRSSSKCLRSST